MGAILAGAENPIHMLRGRIVTADDFIRLRREIELAAREIQPVRGMQRAQIDGGQRLAGNQIDDRNCVQSTVGTAVVRDEGEFAVVGGNDLVRIGPEGTRARTCNVAGSTIATVLSLFASTRRVAEGAAQTRDSP